MNDWEHEDTRETERVLTLVQWAAAWSWISTLSDIRSLPETS